MPNHNSFFEKQTAELPLVKQMGNTNLFETFVIVIEECFPDEISGGSRHFSHNINLAPTILVSLHFKNASKNTVCAVLRMVLPIPRASDIQSNVLEASSLD
jgi:hypothetical protein